MYLGMETEGQSPVENHWYIPYFILKDKTLQVQIISQTSFIFDKQHY